MLYVGVFYVFGRSAPKNVLGDTPKGATPITTRQETAADIFLWVELNLIASCDEWQLHLE